MSSRKWWPNLSPSSPYARRCRSFRPWFRSISCWRRESGKSQREVLHAVDDAAIHRQVAVGAQHAPGFVHRGHDRFDRDFAIGGNDLPAVDPLVAFAAGDGFAPSLAPALGGDEPEQLQEGFQAEGARHHRALLEVRLEKPFIPRDPASRAYEPHAFRPAARN